MRLQMTVNLRDGVHRHIDHDQKRGAAKIKRQGRIGNKPFGQQADHGKVEGAKHRDSGENVVDILRRALARPYPGDEAAVLLQIIRGVGGIEDRRGVEEGEEDDQRRVENKIERAAAPE